MEVRKVQISKQLKHTAPQTYLLYASREYDRANSLADVLLRVCADRKEKMCCSVMINIHNKVSPSPFSLG